MMSNRVLLETRSLTKKFGELVAVAHVDFVIEEGLVHSLIGPNGAGKTTFFNMLAGEFPPTSGKILFKGDDITGLTSNRVSHLGIGRSFQVTSLFPDLTVLENVQLAVQSRGRQSYRFLQKVSKLHMVDQKAEEILRKIGLVDKRSRKASELPHGDQRALEVGIALATEPVLLLLDEPTSGMPPAEGTEIMGLIKTLSEGITILLIEHKMNIVLSISDRITVMHEGRIIAEGPPDQIKENIEVRKAYLGGVH